MNRPMLNLGVFILLLVGILAVIIIYPTLNKPDKMGPKELTISKLRRIEGRMLDYHSDNRTWPDPKSWEEELKPYLSRDRSFRPEDLVVDAWGTKVKYKTRSDDDAPQRILYSFGPDRKDNDGTNDDVLIRVFDPYKPRP